MATYTILFADVARYSTLSDAEQLDVVARLTRIIEHSFIADSLKNPLSGNAFIATGDGMIIALSGEGISREPEQAVRLATKVVEEMNPYQVRIGLHHGDAESYPDFNSRFYQSTSVRNNLAGKTINFAQRIMSLADPGDILASGEFYEHCDAKQPQVANSVFNRIGIILVKHRKRLLVYKHHSAGQFTIPKRILTYMTAQRSITELLERICRKVDNCPYSPSRGKLETRVTLLPFDRHDQVLYVSGLRGGVGPNEPQHNLKFTLEEGPGRSYAAALASQPAIQYFELPPPPNSTPLADSEKYLNRFEHLSGIPRAKIKTFQRPSHSYLYYPVYYGPRDGNGKPFAVISIDTMKPIFPEAAYRSDKKERGGRKTSEQVKKRIAIDVHKLVKGLQDWSRQLGDSWTILRQYW